MRNPAAMAIGNEPAAFAERHDAVTRLLHWLTAGLVVTLFALAEIWGFLPWGPLRHGMQSVHISLGMALFVTVTLRIVWRSAFAHRLPSAERGLPGAAAEAMHLLLYALLIVMICTGPLRQWSEGRGLSFFGLLSVPAPVAVPFAWHRLASTIHVWAAWSIIILAALHAAAALFHHYALKDGVLLRMMPRRNS